MPNPPRRAPGATNVTPNAALTQARKDYQDWVGKDKANGGPGTVYNLDGSVATPENWITSQAGKYMSGALKHPGAPAAPQQAAPQAPPQGGQQPQGGPVLPPRPAGAPPTAKFSPSQKNWWWQDPQSGAWAHS